MSETKGIRVSVETHDRLRSLAAKHDRTISATAERLLQPALEIQELAAEQEESVRRIEGRQDREFNKKDAGTARAGEPQTG